MFFAPTVINELLAQWGRENLDAKSDAALTQLVDAALENGWITVKRCENLQDAQAAYKDIVTGQVPPSEAVVISLNGVS